MRRRSKSACRPCGNPVIEGKFFYYKKKDNDNIGRIYKGNFSLITGKMVNIHVKQELRQRILDRIKEQKEEIALSKSRIIFAKVIALPVFQSARTILFYASFRGEVDTFALMREAMVLNKRVALPLIRKEEQRIVPMLIKTLSGLRPGPYGIMTPEDEPRDRVDAAELDLVVVPGVAFDRRHNRLGRGAGYYDRFLSGLSATTPTIGLAYDLQVVDAITGIEAHDRPVTYLVTN